MLYRTIFIASSYHRYRVIAPSTFFTCAVSKKIASDVNIHLVYLYKQRNIGSFFLFPKRSFSLRLVVKLSKMYQRFICRLSQYKPAKKAF